MYIAVDMTLSSPKRLIVCQLVESTTHLCTARNIKTTHTINHGNNTIYSWPLLHSLHWLPVRQRVTYKLAVLTHKVWTTATATYLSELVQIHAPPRALRSSNARRSSDTYRTGPSRFFCCCSIHLELSTYLYIRLCW